MESVLEIRKKYGLSLSQLAGYLGISKSLVAMVEASKRSLPNEAFKKLATLALSYEENAKELVLIQRCHLPTRQRCAGKSKR